MDKDRTAGVRHKEYVSYPRVATALSLPMIRSCGLNRLWTSFGLIPQCLPLANAIACSQSYWTASATTSRRNGRRACGPPPGHAGGSCSERSPGFSDRGVPEAPGDELEHLSLPAGQLQELLACLVRLAGGGRQVPEGWRSMSGGTTAWPNAISRTAFARHLKRADLVP